MTILFIAIAHSSHTTAWINLLNGSDLNFLVYGVEGTRSTSFPAYQTSWFEETTLQRRKRIMFSKLKLIKNVDTYLQYQKEQHLKDYVLAAKPDVVHTLGFETAGYDFLKVVDAIRVHHNFVWVHTARGGPEMVLNGYRNKCHIAQVLKKCDYFIADNQNNYEIAFSLGLKKEKAYKKFVPGTGGVQVTDHLKRKAPARRSRVILFPKAYECPASKALPVFEALKNCWDRIQPCQVVMTAMTPETTSWFYTLPKEIIEATKIYDRVPRAEILRILKEARVLLAPSLTDGIPNILYEAMAAGVFPILSPIDTLTPIFKHKSNLLYARNLYVHEIEEALTFAMNDDDLIEKVTSTNFALVKEIADRKAIQKEIVEFYNSFKSDTF